MTDGKKRRDGMWVRMYGYSLEQHLLNEVVGVKTHLEYLKIFCFLWTALEGLANPLAELEHELCFLSKTLCSFGLLSIKTFGVETFNLKNIPLKFIYFSMLFE